MRIQGTLPSPVGCSLNHARPARERLLRLACSQAAEPAEPLFGDGDRGRGARKTAGRADCDLSDSQLKGARAARLRLGAGPAGTAC